MTRRSFRGTRSAFFPNLQSLGEVEPLHGREKKAARAQIHERCRSAGTDLGHRLLDHEIRRTVLEPIHQSLGRLLRSQCPRGGAGLQHGSIAEGDAVEVCTPASRGVDLQLPLAAVEYAVQPETEGHRLGPPRIVGDDLEREFPRALLEKPVDLPAGINDLVEIIRVGDGDDLVALGTEPRLLSYRADAALLLEDPSAVWAIDLTAGTHHPRYSPLGRRAIVAATAEEDHGLRVLLAQRIENRDVGPTHGQDEVTKLLRQGGLQVFGGTEGAL